MPAYARAMLPTGVLAGTLLQAQSTVVEGHKTRETPQDGKYSCVYVM